MKKKLNLLFILMVFPLMFFAQTQMNVNGKIVDTKGEPIIGANVIELGNRTN